MTVQITNGTSAKLDSQKRCSVRGGLDLKPTGWPASRLLQDDDSKLSAWFASRPNARMEAREVGSSIAAEAEAARKLKKD